MLSDLLKALSHYPEERYEPDPGVVGELGEALKGKRILVFSGPWCRDCIEGVPKIASILKAVRPEPEVEFHQIERGPFTHPEMKRWAVMAIPTLLVVREGREIGRIVETPEGSWESHILQIAAR